MLGRARRAARWLALGALSAASDAAAQAPSEPNVERRDRIEVTGSRIVNSEVESASPIAIISAEEIRNSGYGTLELILNNFPQLVADQGGRVSNGATGTSTANLRGLLPGRTLILVNGRRLLSGSPFLLAGDLNQIPVQLISRIEILTGGASAVHGSDAIAGVINIFLNDRFEGVAGDVAHDFFNHRQKNDRMAGLLRNAGIEVPGDKSHDGATTVASLTLGGNFAADRGNAVASFRYLRSDALLQSERDYSACALTIIGFGTPGATEACGGSNTGYPGRFVDVVTRRLFTVADAAGGVRPWSATRDLYNFGPVNYYQRPTERYGVNAFAHYDVSATTRLYSEFGFHDDKTVSQIAPSGVFGGIQTIRWENPLLSDAWRSSLTFRNPDGTPGTGPGSTASVVIQRRNIEGGGRQAALRHTSFREVVGASGELGGPWAYDISYQAARVVASEFYTRDLSVSRVARALDVVTDPVTGQPVCASVLDGTDPACLPYDVWRLGRVTPQTQAYLEMPALRRGFTSQSLFSAEVRGDLADYGWRLPWTRDAVEVALGFERRSDRMDLSTDAASASGDLAGSPGSSPPIQGSVSVKELFGEVRVPVLEALALSGSFRISDYSTGVRSETFGAGFNASPAEALRLRGSYQRAVRAANLAELFTPQIESGWGLFPEDDPCAGPTPARSLADCQRTGVTAAQYGNIPLTPPGVGYPAILGGNPALEPETANTLTLGLAFTPSSTFSATLDYFDIRVDDFIFGGTPEVTFQRCLDTGDPALCGLIRRDPALGVLWLAPAQVVATNQNIGRVHVAGADVAVTWRHRSIGVAALGTWLRTFTRENYRGAEAIQCVGRFLHPCHEPRPRWRHRVRGTWDTPWGVQASATWRYIHSVQGMDLLANLRFPAVSYLDIGASWAIGERLVLRAGVNNVADRDPPLVAAGGTPTINGNTFVQTYDALGRHIFLSLVATF